MYLCGFLLSTRNLYPSRAFGRLKQGKLLWKHQEQSRLFWKGSLGTTPQRRGNQKLPARKHPNYKGKEGTLATGNRTQGWAGRQALEEAEKPAGGGWVGCKSRVHRISKLVASRLQRGLRTQEATMIPNGQVCIQIPRLQERKEYICPVTARSRETQLLLPRREASAWHF